MIANRAQLYTALLETPTIYRGDVPDCAEATGVSGWEWPLLQRDAQGGIKGRGNVYFGRAGNGLVKVGFSQDPAKRMLELGLGPLLVVLTVQQHHERALHRLFARDLMHRREYFGGALVEAFIAKGRAMSDRVLRSWTTADDAHRRERALLRGKAA
jgi:hypothetical protein